MLPEKGLGFLSEKAMDIICYNLLYAAAWLLSLLPMRVMYWLSDLTYVLVYHVAGYRRRVVRDNLASSFPEKTVQELRQIEKKFYHWFCDYVFEAVKLLSISDKELRKRFIITNSEAVTACFEQGQSVGALLGHYANWEWLSCVGIDLPENTVQGLIYHPLRNRSFDRLFQKIRSHGTPIPKNDILRYLRQYRQMGIMSIFGYIADQSPKWENIHLWLPFLGHDTPVFTGAEKIIRKMDHAVFYVEMSRPRRGCYTCTYHLIAKEPRQLPEYELTRRFFAMLEQTIRRQPELYLWSHKRWKRTREEFERRFQVVNGKVLPKS